MSVHSNPELCVKSKTVHVMPQSSTENASSEKNATTHPGFNAKVLLLYLNKHWKHMTQRVLQSWLHT